MTGEKSVDSGNLSKEVLFGLVMEGAWSKRRGENCEYFSSQPLEGQNGEECCTNRFVGWEKPSILDV